MDMTAVTAKTVGEAVTKVLVELEATNGKLEYEIVDRGSTGPLDIGAKPIIIRAKRKGSIEDKTMDFLSQIFGIVNMQMNITATYSQEEQEPSLNLEGGGMGTLIGKGGQALDSLQYLASLIVNKGIEGYFRVKLDTKNCREGRKKILETLVKNVAYKVKRTKRPVSSESINSYKRGIIHAALQNDKYVTTRSGGEESLRHMVIALKKETVSGDRRGYCDRNKGRYSKRSDRSGGYRNNRRTNGNSVSQIGSDVSAETVAGEGE